MIKFTKVKIENPSYRNELTGHVEIEGDFGTARVEITRHLSDALLRECHKVIMEAVQESARLFLVENGNDEDETPHS